MADPWDDAEEVTAPLLSLAANLTPLMLLLLPPFAHARLKSIAVFNAGAAATLVQLGMDHGTGFAVEYIDIPAGIGDGAQLEQSKLPTWQFVADNPTPASNGIQAQFSGGAGPVRVLATFQVLRGAAVST